MLDNSIKMADYYIEIVRNLILPMVLFLIAWVCIFMCLKLNIYKYLCSKIYGDTTKNTTTISEDAGEKTNI